MQTHIIFNTAMSLDGHIGKKDKEIVFANELDNHRVHRLRGSVDAIMVSGETVTACDPDLSVSTTVKKPYRVIVDNRAEIPLDSKVFDGKAETILAVSKSASLATLRKLENMGVDIIILGEYAVPLKDLVWSLYRRGIRRILVEGGGSLTRRLFNEDLISEVYITVAPMLLGDGIDLFDGDLEKNVHLELDGILQYGDQVVMHYLVKEQTKPMEKSYTEPKTAIPDPSGTVAAGDVQGSKGESWYQSL